MGVVRCVWGIFLNNLQVRTKPEIFRKFHSLVVFVMEETKTKSRTFQKFWQYQMEHSLKLISNQDSEVCFFLADIPKFLIYYIIPNIIKKSGVLDRLWSWNPSKQLELKMINGSFFGEKNLGTIEWKCKWDVSHCPCCGRSWKNNWNWKIVNEEIIFDDLIQKPTLRNTLQVLIPIRYLAAHFAP